jgi:hypothetical protein
MSISAITNMLSYLPQPVGSIANVASNFLGSGATASSSSTPTASSTPAATTQLSPVGFLLNQLQQVQQNNPAKFAKVTAAISTKLQKAATQVQANGDAALANKLSALAQTFQTASQTGQMPSLSSLQAAVTGGGNSQGLGLAAAYQAASQSSMNVLSAVTASMPASIL